MKRIVALISMVAALLCFCVPAAAEDVKGGFSDVPAAADYATAVYALVADGIMSGYSDNTFHPDATMTRAEFSAVVCRLLGVEKEAKELKASVFSDVPTSYWAVGYIAKASELKIISGYGDGKFRPNGTITYGQAVKMLVCAYNMAEQAVQEGGYPNGYLAVAAHIGMTNKISIPTGSPASRAIISQLLYNATSIS